MAFYNKSPLNIANQLRRFQPSHRKKQKLTLKPQSKTVNEKLCFIVKS